MGVQDEKWAHNYRYHVGNVVRLVNIELQTHVLSHLHIEGNMALVTYAGQPTTCYICNETTHMANECPTRKSPRTDRLRTYRNTWANVVELGYCTGLTRETTVEEPEETRQPLHRAPERTIQIGHKNQTTSRHQQSQETTIDKTDQMTEELQIQEESGNDKSVEKMETNYQQEQQVNIDHKNIPDKQKKKERKGDKDIIATSIIPKKWSEMEQEETTHSVRVDGMKLRNRTTQGEER